MTEQGDSYQQPPPPQQQAPPPQYQQPPPQPYGPPPQKRSGMPTAAGILNIVGGVIALGILAWFLIAWLTLSTYTDYWGNTVSEEFVGFFGLGMICLIMPIIGMIFAIIGGVFCLKRKNWGMALAGSLIGMIFGGGIFCLIALILVAISKDEFS